MSTIRESTVETRKLILNSAEEIFLECGYQEASMRKIAAKAGITPGAIYKHFSNKAGMAVPAIGAYLPYAGGRYAVISYALKL